MDRTGIIYKYWFFILGFSITVGCADSLETEAESKRNDNLYDLLDAETEKNSGTEESETITSLPPEISGVHLLTFTLDEKYLPDSVQVYNSSVPTNADRLKVSYLNKDISTGRVTYQIDSIEDKSPTTQPLFVKAKGIDETEFGAVKQIIVDNRKTYEIGHIKLERMGKIFGRLVGSNEDRKMLGVSVFIPGTIFSVKTDEKGSFTIEPFIPKDEFRLVAQADGFLPYQSDPLVVDKTNSLDVGEVLVDLDLTEKVPITIVGGKKRFGVKEIDFAVGANDYVQRYRYAIDDPDFIGADIFEISSSIKIKTDKEGPQKIFFEFSGKNGIETTIYAFDVIVDTKAPELGEVIVSNSSENNQNVYLNGGPLSVMVTSSKNNNESTPSFVRVSQVGENIDNADWLPWVENSFTQTKIMPKTLGSKYQIQGKDFFGRLSSVHLTDFFVSSPYKGVAQKEFSIEEDCLKPKFPGGKFELKAIQQVFDTEKYFSSYNVTHGGTSVTVVCLTTDNSSRFLFNEITDSQISPNNVRKTYFIEDDATKDVLTAIIREGEFGKSRVSLYRHISKNAYTPELVTKDKTLDSSWADKQEFFMLSGKLFLASFLVSPTKDLKIYEFNNEGVHRSVYQTSYSPMTKNSFEVLKVNDRLHFSMVYQKGIDFDRFLSSFSIIYKNGSFELEKEINLELDKDYLPITFMQSRSSIFSVYFIPSEALGCHYLAIQEFSTSIMKPLEYTSQNTRICLSKRSSSNRDLILTKDFGGGLISFAEVIVDKEMVEYQGVVTDIHKPSPHPFSTLINLPNNILASEASADFAPFMIEGSNRWIYLLE